MSATSPTPDRGDLLAGPAGTELPPALCADLLDSARWYDGLNQYARTTNLAVALVDTEGRLLGPIIHPHPLWELLRAHKPAGLGGCPFCLIPTQGCTCVADALATGQTARTRGRSGLVHFAVPLVLGEHRLGVILAGQVFDHYPEQLAVEYVARQCGITPQEAWQRARLEHPVKPATLDVYAGLLATLGQTFLQTRYHALTEADRLAEMTRLRDQAVAEMTERERAEEARRQSEERFGEIVRQVAAGIAQTDLSGRFVLVNDRYCEIVGRSREELLQLRMQDITHPEDLARNLPLFERAVTEGKSFVIEKRYVRPDGSAVWVNNCVSLVKYLHGKPPQIVAVTIDDTERKRAEEALKEADRRKDQFLATLAHELRNPLAPLRNIAQILRLDSRDPSRIELARDMIERQVGQMTRLVDDLLDVSRVTTGKVRLRKEPVDLAAVVARAVETSREFVDARKHELTVALPAEPVWLDADPVRLTQVLTNLLNNAAKYTDEGGRIGLTVEREGGEAVVCVRDTGVGIAPEMLPHVFDLFTQADRSLAHSQGGLGIGLSMVRSLVELHGGSVRAASAGLGQGSTFDVHLPLRPEPRRPEEAKKEGNGRRARASARRVLVVDDNHDSADSLALLLKIQGHEVWVAHDGPSALAAAAASLPEVVLLDVGMPGMDGYEVARRLRQQPALTKALVVALTGYGQDEAHRRSREAGFDHHLVKPVDLTALDELFARATALPTRGTALA